LGTSTKQILDPSLASQPSTPGGDHPARLNHPTLLVVAIVVAVACAAYFSRGYRSRSRDAGQHFVTVSHGDLVRSLRLQGTTEAVQYFGVTAPQISGGGMGQLTITKLVHSGTAVHKGDVLVEFDRQNQTKNALDRETEYKDLLQQIEKKKAEQSAALASDRTELLIAEHALQSAKLETRKNEVLSKIDAEKNEQAVEEAKATFEQLKQTFDLKRTAAAAELKILEIQRDRALDAMRHSQQNSERLSVRSPIDGVAVVNTIWKGGQMGEVQEGDQLYPGTPFLQIVNPAQMRVKVRAMQSDVRFLHAGQTAHVTLDAYPGTSFPAKLESIASIGETSGLNSKVHFYSVLVSIDATDARLMPDLSAAVDVELSRSPQVRSVPLDAVQHEQNADYVWIETGAQVQKTAVQLGARNDTDVVVLSALPEGTRVLNDSSSREGTH
jgi:HlyD family secretion protein